MEFCSELAKAMSVIVRLLVDDADDQERWKLVFSKSAIVDGHADVHASAVMTDDNNDYANVGNLDDTLSEILGASSRVATSLDLDLAFGAVDVNNDFACTSLHSPLSPLPPPIASPPSSAAAGEPI